MFQFSFDVSYQRSDYKAGCKLFITGFWSQIRFLTGFFFVAKVLRRPGAGHIYGRKADA